MITVIATETHAITDGPPGPVNKLYEQSFEDLDLSRLILALNQPRRKRRSDAGQAKGKAKE